MPEDLEEGEREATGHLRQSPTCWQQNKVVFSVRKATAAAGINYYCAIGQMPDLISSIIVF